jgi:hypothetical protein
MKSSLPELTQRIVLLIKNDATNLFERISERKEDYIEIFSLHRNRAVFKDIFDCRYSRASMGDLIHCPSEIIELCNDFYQQADQLYWYLKSTQDMPKTIEDEVNRKIVRLKKKFQNLILFINAELAGKEQIENADDFQLHGEIVEIEKSEEFLDDFLSGDGFLTENQENNFTLDMEIGINTEIEQNKK